jgi:hypothetical protein
MSNTRCDAGGTAYTGPVPASVLTYAGMSGAAAGAYSSCCARPSTVQLSRPLFTATTRACISCAVRPSATSICVNPNDVT